MDGGNVFAARQFAEKAVRYSFRIGYAAFNCRGRGLSVCE